MEAVLKCAPHPLAIYEAAGASGGLGFWRGMGRGGALRIKPFTHLRYFPGSSHLSQVKKVTHKPRLLQPEVHHGKLRHTHQNANPR